MGSQTFALYPGIVDVTVPSYSEFTARQFPFSEKLHILEYKGDNLLNNRNEIISKCRHQNKFLLAHIDSKD